MKAARRGRGRPDRSTHLFVCVHERVLYLVCGILAVTQLWITLHATIMARATKRSWHFRYRRRQSMH